MNKYEVGWIIITIIIFIALIIYIYIINFVKEIIHSNTYCQHIRLRLHIV
jgi:hypothetical protein